MNENLLKELKKSSINETIISLNFKEVNEEQAFENICYFLDDSNRRNDGRLRDNILRKYKHFADGGWWCNGIDLTTLEPSNWGCLKPNKPRIINGKPVKYEHPPNAPTGVFALEVGQHEFEVIAKVTDETKATIEGKKFWQWVIENPVPVIITEGAKKCASLLSNFHVSIALPGIWNGVKDDVLIPELQILAQQNREFIIAFDEDSKWLTRNDVLRASKKLGEAILNWNGSCQVSVMEWETEEGKGIDDVITLGEKGRLQEIYALRKPLDIYVEENSQVPYFKYPDLLKFIYRVLGKRLEFNEMSGRIELDGKALKIDTSLIFYFIEHFNVQASLEGLQGALLHVAKQNSYNPVQRYLTQCSKLEPLSIDNLSTRYFGTNDKHCDIFVKKWLIGAVARAFEPGCKMDYALLLQSRTKGLGKSTWFAVMGGEFYNGSLGDKFDAKGLLTLHSKWIHEWAEFDHITGKNDAAKIKAFVTIAEDNFVEQYGKESLPHSRPCVLCGTINEDEFLRDPDGDRRFPIISIPSSLNSIDTNLLKEERDRLWAGAVKAYFEGKKQGINAWAFTREEEAEIIKRSKEFNITDDTDCLVQDFCEDKSTVWTELILKECFQLTPGMNNYIPTQRRVTNALRKLEWKKIGTKFVVDPNDPDEKQIRRQVWQNPSVNFTDLTHTTVETVHRQKLTVQKVEKDETSHSDSVSHTGNISPDHQDAQCAQSNVGTVHETVHSEKTCEELISEICAQSTPKNEQNFSPTSPKPAKLVETDPEDDEYEFEEDDEIRVGDRVRSSIHGGQGRVVRINHKRTEAEIFWDDPKLRDRFKATFIHYVEKIKS